MRETAIGDTTQGEYLASQKDARRRSPAVTTMKQRLLMNFLVFLMPLCCPRDLAATVVVGKYKTHELVFAAATSPTNPFDTYLLKLELTDPAGRKFTVDGFYDGDGNGGQNGRIWKARISPYMAGRWSWRTVPVDAPDAGLADLHGEFTCIESGDLGGIITDGRYFRFQDSDYIYLVGNFLDTTVRFTHVYMSEMISDSERDSIIARNVNFHTANKINVYFANKGDYRGIAVTPWVGTPATNDKTRMDLTRWKLYDQYIRRFKDQRMFAEMWFFADDSKFGRLSDDIKNRLFRYAMARTSAFSHTLYVIALEWEEGWSLSSVMRSGIFIQRHNPWGRPLSVHSVGGHWLFSGAPWASFIASQARNNSKPPRVNRIAIALSKEKIPHLGEEFGYLNTHSDERLRANLWANFLGGAAGAGTGSDLRAFQRFLSQSRIPFHRMSPANGLVEDGGFNRFVLAEAGHHYAVYSRSGGSFKLNVHGHRLVGQWFNPRDPTANLGIPFRVTSDKQIFAAPSSIGSDWVLWISDATNLGSGLVHPSPGATVTQQLITRES